MNLAYAITDLTEVTKGTFISEKGNNFTVQNIIIDSRNYFNDADTLFVAIDGDNNNGHNYIRPLYEKGCRGFLVSESFDAADFPEAYFIVVENTILAFQQIAAYHRQQFDIPVIGITGSNGKTIIKEWLYYYLRHKYNIVRSPKSYNSQVGVALSILQLTNQHTLAIFEAGISHPNEMEKLTQMIQPTYGILTQLGSAHSENFDSREHLKIEKTKLFSDADWWYSFERNNLVCNEFKSKNGQTTLVINQNQGSFEVTIPFIDEASIQNAITAIGFMLQLGIGKELICNASLSLPSLALRLESRQGQYNNIIIDDSYSSDLISLKIGLNHITKIDDRSSKVVILSDIKQDKSNPETLYTEVSNLISSRDITQFYGVGKLHTAHQQLFRQGTFFETTADLLAHLKENPIENSIIYIKGARTFEFERIGRLFERKNHDTQLTVNLGALKDNITTYKQMLHPKTMILGMVKAYGYGSGSIQIGKTLAASGVNYLGVAYADEGEALREGNISLPIIVMNSEEGSFDKMINHKLEPSIFSFKQLDRFIRALIDRGLKSYPIHLKLDTGMNRLGFVSSDIEELISTITAQPEIRITSIFSHLAASDMPREDMFTNKQIQKFQYEAHKIETGLGYNCIKHILNSAGVERFTYAQLDMVRLGLGMFGESTALKNLEPVGQLTSIISQIKNVKKGSSVGYNRSQYALRDSIIGIIPIGYADGFGRELSKGIGHVWINGELAPVFGTVCMDMIMVDLTDIPAKEGDSVEIFGKNRPLKELAKEMNTIVYEVMTSISQRVVRVYLD